MTNYETTLREDLRELNQLPGLRVDRIRNAYYKATEALRALVDQTELADLDLANHRETDGGGPLISEHLIACAALEELEKSALGKVL